jgi:hypothetical protein
MKRFVYRSLTAAALMTLPVAAQLASRAVTPAPATTQATRALKIPLSTLYSIERSCDDKLRGIGEPNTVDLLGATRGVYLDGYGAVFSAEISLVTPPAIYPFHPKPTNDDVTSVHSRKVQRLPRLRTAMQEMMKAAAASLAAMPENQQIVLVVRLDNMKWEDTSGLPGMVTIKADRKSALAGIFQTEEE